MKEIGTRDRIACVLFATGVLLAALLPLTRALAAPPEAANPRAGGAAATPVTAPASAPESALVFTQSRLLHTFLDANQDGYITLAEARRLRGFEAAFLEADENQDGRLSREEFARAQAVHDRVRGAGCLNDGVITAKVKSALQKESELREADLQVETYDGQVILAGKVDSPARARKAMEIAAAVSGVDAVKSTIAIKMRA